MALLEWCQSCCPGWAAELWLDRDASASKAFGSSVCCHHELLCIREPLVSFGGYWEGRGGQWALLLLLVVWPGAMEVMWWLGLAWPRSPGH